MDTYDLPARFWAKVRQDGDCWVWTGALVKDGYGAFNLGQRRTCNTVHRLTYTLLRAEIPAGLVLDHLCRRPACVNPWHLEPVTNAVNTQRGLVSNTNTVRNRNHDTCKSGRHPWIPENWEFNKTSGKKTCRECKRDYMAAYHQRRKAA